MGAEGRNLVEKDFDLRALNRRLEGIYQELSPGKPVVAAASQG
jgi:hypothetical protein